MALNPVKATDIELDTSHLKPISASDVDIDTSGTGDIYKNNPILREMGVVDRGMLQGLAAPIDLIQFLAKHAPDPLGPVAPKGVSPEEYQKFQDETVYKPASTRVRDFIDRITGNQLQPQNKAERYVDTGAQFMSAGGALGKLSPALEMTKADIAPTLGAAAGAQTVRENGGPSWLEFLASIAGGKLGSSIKGAEHLSSTFAPKSPEDLVSKAVNGDGNVVFDFKPNKSAGQDIGAKYKIVSMNEENYNKYLPATAKDKPFSEYIAQPPTNFHGDEIPEVLMLSSDNGEPYKAFMAKTKDYAEKYFLNRKQFWDQGSEIASQKIRNFTPKDRAENLVKSSLTVDEAKQAFDRTAKLNSMGIDSPLAVLTDNNQIYRIAENRAQSLKGAEAAGANLTNVITSITKNENDFIKNLSSNSTSVADDANVFKTSAESIKNAIIDSRRTRAKPYYDNIKNAGFPQEVANKMISASPIVKSEYIGIAKDPVSQELLQGLEPNTIGYWDMIKRIIDGKAEKAATYNDATSALAYNQAAQKIRDTLDEVNPSYKKARDAFASDSQVLDKFLGGDKNSAIKKIINLSGDDASRAYNTIFNLQPQDIAKMRTSFARFGQPEAFNALTRGFLTKKLVEARGQGVYLSKVLNTDAILERVQAAIGDPKKVELFNDVLKTSDMVASAKKLNPQSGARTFGAGDTDRVINEAGRSGTTKTLLLPGKVYKFAKRAVGLGESEVDTLLGSQEYYTELQKILFDPQRGKQFLSDYVKAGKDAPEKIKVAASVINTVADKLRNTSSNLTNAAISNPKVIGPAISNINNQNQGQ